MQIKYLPSIGSNTDSLLGLTLLSSLSDPEPESDPS